MGGKYHLKSDILSCLLKNTRDIGSKIIESISLEAQMPKIHIDFVDNKSFNAVAFKHEDTYFIGIHTGTITCLHAFFNYIEADP